MPRDTEFTDNLGGIIESEFTLYVQDRNNYEPSEDFKDDLTATMMDRANAREVLNLEFTEAVLRNILAERGRNLQEAPPIKIIAEVYNALFHTLNEVANNYPPVNEVKNYLTSLVDLEHGRNLVPLIAAYYIAHCTADNRRDIYNEITEFLEEHGFVVDEEFRDNSGMEADEAEELELPQNEAGPHAPPGSPRPRSPSAESFGWRPRLGDPDR